MTTPMPLPANAIDLDGTPQRDGNGDPCPGSPWPVIEPEAPVVVVPVLTAPVPAVVDVTLPGIYVGGIRQPDPAPPVETA